VAFHVDSEVGRLRQVIVHRPGLELSRLTRGNIAGLLFDDIMWPERARQEHDQFAGALRDRGVVVRYFADLLAEALDESGCREFVAERVYNRFTVGPTLVGPLWDLMAGSDGRQLASLLIGGVLKRDLQLPASTGSSLLWNTLGPDDFVLAPLPNHLYQRDNSAWVYDGVVLSRMARDARRRESVHSRAIYAFHPLFRNQEPFWLGDSDGDYGPATFEGGDIHVIGNGSVMVGVGERTTPTGIENLAMAWFERSGGRIARVIAVELPKSRAFMHLDTAMTMVDHETFVVYPYLPPDFRSFTLTPDGTRRLRVEENRSLWPAVAGALGGSAVRVLSAEADIRSAEREQWDDGNNFLAVAPGVVLGYDRNTATNAYLGRHGIEVVAVPGSELGRGRGGPRCMACPIERESV
jgi:arginine deiminase